MCVDRWAEVIGGKMAGWSVRCLSTPEETRVAQTQTQTIHAQTTPSEVWVSETESVAPQPSLGNSGVRVQDLTDERDWSRTNSDHMVVSDSAEQLDDLTEANWVNDANAVVGERLTVVEHDGFSSNGRRHVGDVVE